jgi:hypothetical protein
MMKIGIMIFLISLCFYIFNWESKQFNSSSTLSLQNCLNLNQVRKTLDDFEVSYIENSSVQCVNPYFPSIKIHTGEQHNAWLHVVHSNSSDPRWRTFVDSVDNSQNLYPFYTYEDDFYDAPLWIYKLWDNLKWEGHAYPVQVDHELKTIEFFSGVKWGFELGNFRLRPQMTLPELITQEDIWRDWEIFQEMLTGYKIKIKNDKNRKINFARMEGIRQG